ncbi:hypothetical protein KIF59_00345 [Enterobacter cloacae subsp. cloacae]|nr:hypothetical protein [Enterobacter cloacae subsp. cloacae]
MYIFHGESDTLPLYISKSVNIRSRVLSHLRAGLKPPCSASRDASAGIRRQGKWERSYWKPG